jgi:GT2 family glycosyltransferase
MTPLVSVVVPSRRDRHLLAEALPRLLEGTEHELEVVLANNEPAEGLARWAERSFPGEPVRVLEMDGNAGFSGAANAAISATHGEYVLLLNSDVLPEPGFVDALAGFLDERPEAGCVTGKLLRYDLHAATATTVIDTAGVAVGRSRRAAHRGEGELDVGQFERPEQVFAASGAALLARRNALESVALEGHYLSESFFMYKEDVDLCWRLRLAGWECWYVPTAVAYHARGARSLGSRPYLADLPELLRVERAKPPDARAGSMRNQWLLLVHNEDAANLARDLPWIAARELGVLAFNALLSPRVLAELPGFARRLPEAIRARREIKRRRMVPPGEIRRWFRGG